MESAVEAARARFDGAPLYRSLAEIAAAYAWGIARNHAFVDGNKRTAFQTAMTFLAANGHSVTVGLEWVELIERVAGSPRLPRLQRHDLVAAFVIAMGADEPVTP